MKKLIVRIKGGLGNQLFCYAAARRLALVNGAELVIDDVTGFSRDSLYRRSYMLDNFLIPCRKATPSERMEPLERGRRAIAKLISRRRSFEKRRYIEQEGIDFDPRLLAFKVDGAVYIDGLWQSEQYFKDHESIIRSDLKMKNPEDEENSRLGELIESSESVAVHFRFFDSPDSTAQNYNIGEAYYLRAFRTISERVASPRFFVFSDQPKVANKICEQTLGSYVVVDINQKSGDDFNDFRLMSACKHFIIANSTYSWWGAWLGNHQHKLVIAPADTISSTGITAWGFKGLLPEQWVRI
jgi:hypothetical protein